MKVAVIILAVLLVGVLVAGGLWVRERPNSHPADQVGEVKSEHDLLGLVAPLIGRRVSDGNRIELLENGEEIFPAMLEAIEQAEDTVHLLTYVYWSGDIAEQFVDAVERAGKRGVEVRVLIDAFGGSKMPDELRQRLDQAPCELAWFRPLEWHQPGKFNRRTHRKILVIDGKVGFAGGVGIADEWTGDGRSENQWRDDHFRIEGPVVADLQGAFAENWLHSTGEVIMGERYFPKLPPTGDAKVLAINSTPEGRDSPLTLAYWALIHRAEHRLDLQTPYFVPHPKMLEEILDAAERGVQVRLLVPGDTNDSDMVRMASQALYPDLLKAGVSVYEYDATMMHAKVVVADDRFSIVGSANLDHRSFELNHETVLVVDDQSLASELHRSFGEDVQFAKRVDPEEFEGIGAAKAWVASTSLAFRSQL